MRAQEKPAGGELSAELLFERDAFLALLNETLRVDSQAIYGPHTAGNDVPIYIALHNRSRHTFAFHERLRLTPLAGVQSWIERLDGDQKITNINPIAARRGNQYAYGWFSFPVPNPLKPEGTTYIRRVSTEGFQPGKYRYAIEITISGTKRFTSIADFELLPPPTAK